MTQMHIAATRKKPIFPVSESLRKYLVRAKRERPLPVSYQQLLHFSAGAPLLDRDGIDTLWETVVYPPEVTRELHKDLARIYTILKAEWDFGGLEHLYVDRIDYCTFGNSNPFRIRIVNAYNDNEDYYYIKQADASRIYGLELEHLLSPHRIYFLTCNETLIEEHIAGIPGDVFIEKWLKSSNIRPIRLAKELVKFNERCFIRLLGDMRPYNFVIDLTPDFEGIQIKIRAMDFDQQCYSGRKNFYFPQFFKENNPLVFFCMRNLNLASAQQYQREEQAVLYRRIQSDTVSQRLHPLLDAMCHDHISTDEKIHDLRESLAEHYQDDAFLKCNRMGEILRTCFDHLGEVMKDPAHNQRLDFLLGS